MLSVPLGRRAGVAAVWTTLAAIFTGQRAAEPTPQTAERQLIRLDVVVANHLGHPIQDLRPSDFELRVDGVRRPIRDVTLRTSERLGKDPAPPITTAADEERAAKERGTRVFAFFLDEFHISPGPAAGRAADVVAAFIDEKLHERDLAAVIRPLDAVGSIRFTRDRALLHGALVSFSGRKAEDSPRTPLEREVVGADPAKALMERRRIVGASLRELGMKIGSLGADRAVVVFVSEGVPEISDVDTFVRASSQFHFPVYTFNPATPEENLSSSAERDRATDMLRRLAVDTGGLFISPGDSISGFARVAHDTESDYSLTYESPESDTRQQIELRVNRRDSWVRSRTTAWPATPGYWSALAALPPTVSPAGDRLLRRSPLIDVWVGVRRESSEAAVMTVTWESRRPGDKSAAAVLLKARGAAGATLFDGSLPSVGSQDGSQGDRARFTTLGGRVELDLKILDNAGVEVDREARDFDIPDLTPTSPLPRLLPVEIVRVRTARELERRIATDAAPAASRSFVRADHLLVRAPAFDAAGLPVGIVARLLNRAGQSIRDLDVVGTLAEQPKQFLLPLSSLPPDLYQIEIVGTNSNGTTKERLGFRLMR